MDFCDPFRGRVSLIAGWHALMLGEGRGQNESMPVTSRLFNVPRDYTESTHKHPGLRWTFAFRLEPLKRRIARLEFLDEFDRTEARIIYSPSFGRPKMKFR